MSTPASPNANVTSADHYYILAPTGAADRPKLVLKHQEAFLVADQRGDFPGIPDSELGLYVGGTRFLHFLELRLFGEFPSLLNTAVSADNVQISIDLANPDIPLGNGLVLMGRTLRVERRLTLAADQMLQLVTVESFAPVDHELELCWAFAADFADLFEVRGTARPRRGTLLPGSQDEQTAHLSYRGLDDVVRTTHLAFSPAPTRLDAMRAHYAVTLPAGGRLELALTVSTSDSSRPPPPPPRLTEVVARRREQDAARARKTTRLRTNNQLVNGWLARATSDLSMLETETTEGRVAYAGIPWFVAPFGRDSLITALQLLPFDPDLARGTLRFLARLQGERIDAFTDQEPGKILHEYRRGEMANCREIAFIPYYGSVDATPLFCMLLAEYRRWTADEPLVSELWPSLERALTWIERQGDPYLTYACRSERGLVHQGWKDSHDAIMHASGADALPPIALVEAQGYQYAALESGAEIAEATGHHEEAVRWRGLARQLRNRFEQDFWMEEERFYALALDGEGRPCRVLSSNPGHCLWAGIVSPDRGSAVAERLMQDSLFSGWGLRTLAAGQASYNPMSYHNGSVWPHDTAIAAAGLRRYGLREAFLRLATGLFDSVVCCDGMRMPELYCGFARMPDAGPIRYPVACSPQAWAAGTVFQLLGVMLGVVPDAPAGRLTLSQPTLPAWLDWIDVRGLSIGATKANFVVSRVGESARLEQLELEGDAAVELVG